MRYPISFFALLIPFIFSGCALFKGSRTSPQPHSDSQLTSCQKKAEAYALAIANLDSESYEVVEMQLGVPVTHQGEVLYRVQYRLAGSTQFSTVALTLDARTCLLERSDIKRE